MSSPVFTPELRAEAERIKARYPAGRERSAVLPLLYLAQSVEGMVTPEALREIGEILGIQTAGVEAVASFYTMVRLRQTGKHVVSVCTNLSCALRGADEVYEAGRQVLGLDGGRETSEDGLVTLHDEECLGACDSAPVATVDFCNHDRVTPDRMREIVESLRGGEVPQPSRGRAPQDFRAASRILAGLGEGEG